VRDDFRRARPGSVPIPSPDTLAPYTLNPQRLKVLGARHAAGVSPQLLSPSGHALPPGTLNPELFAIFSQEVTPSSYSFQGARSSTRSACSPTTTSSPPSSRRGAPPPLVFWETTPLRVIGPEHPPVPVIIASTLTDSWHRLKPHRCVSSSPGHAPISSGRVFLRNTIAHRELEPFLHKLG